MAAVAGAAVILEKVPFTLEQMPFRRLCYQCIVVFLTFFPFSQLSIFSTLSPCRLICSTWTITKKR